MKIFVDADACPVVRITEKLAKRTPEDDKRFEESFERMIQKAMG